jgi:competence protein ComFC
MTWTDLLFPKNCLGCKKEGGYMCPDCVQKTRLLKQVCPYCEKASIDGFTHTKCRKKYGLDGLTSVWKYEGVIKNAILSLKYKYATEIVREICGYYMPELRNLLFVVSSSSILVPIPIYWYKENIRGFNQSADIGKIIARELGWGYNSGLLFRKKSVKPQAGLTVAERKKNLKGVFAIYTQNPTLDLPGSVVLFDDVFTTGSTLHEACKILKKSGVERVWGMTIAR